MLFKVRQRILFSGTLQDESLIVHAIWPNSHKCQTKILVPASTAHGIDVFFVRLLTPSEILKVCVYAYVYMYTDIIYKYVIFTSLQFLK